MLWKSTFKKQHGQFKQHPGQENIDQNGDDQCQFQHKSDSQSLIQLLLVVLFQLSDFFWPIFKNFVNLDRSLLFPLIELMGMDSLIIL